MCRRSPGEVAAFTVVDDNRLLAGRPAAASMSNSKPSVLGARVATWPLCSWATDVLRQRQAGSTRTGPGWRSHRQQQAGWRRTADRSVSSRGCCRPGRAGESRIPPGARPLRAGVDLRVGDALLVANERSVGRGGPGDGRLEPGAPRTSLPVMKMRCRPACRAASTFARMAPDQYSSWPLEMNTLRFWSTDAWRWVSMLPQ